MEEGGILDVMSVKNFDKEKVVERVFADNKLIDELLEGVSSKKSSVKYGSERVLRAISEAKPEILYPYFDKFAALMQSNNNVIKWGAITIIANLTVVDFDNKFDDLFVTYFKPIKGPIVLTAGTIIDNAPTIAMEKPYLSERIMKEILLVEKAKYKTPDCRNIAVEHAINAFGQFVELIHDKKMVVNFVKRYVESNKEPVKKSAIRFMRKYSKYTK